MTQTGNISSKNLIIVKVWVQYLCQEGSKSPYITVIGSTAVTKALYDRLEPLCYGGLLPTDRPSPQFINTAWALQSLNACIYYIIVFQANSRQQCVIDRHCYRSDAFQTFITCLQTASSHTHTCFTGFKGSTNHVLSFDEISFENRTHIRHHLNFWKFTKHTMNVSLCLYC